MGGVIYDLRGAEWSECMRRPTIKNAKIEVKHIHTRTHLKIKRTGIQNTVAQEAWPMQKGNAKQARKNCFHPLGVAVLIFVHLYVRLLSLNLDTLHESNARAIRLKKYVCSIDNAPSAFFLILPMSPTALALPSAAPLNHGVFWR